MAPLLHKAAPQNQPRGRQNRGLRCLLAVGLIVALAASCAPMTSGPNAPGGSPTAPAGGHGDQIRFALIGDVTRANVWALFDRKGYSYNNYAVRSAYWPRLYTLSVPDERLVTATASDLPSKVQPEGTYFTATVPLRTDLTWSDGTPFTAEDVASTVNTALRFDLGFDWRDHYDPRWLDHVEAIDAHTAKFFFAKMPNVEVWQYGALQGAVAQSKYWSPRVTSAAALLPSTDLIATVASLRAKVSDLQARVNAINASAVTAQGAEIRILQANLRRQQGDLDQANNDLAKAESALQSAMNAARDSLYALDDAGEPHLGKWAPAAPPEAETQGDSLENEANPAYPGVKPHFDRAVYFTYPTRAAAEAALSQGSVDVILNPESPAAAAGQAAQMVSPSRNARFLFLNTSGEALQQRAFRQALACVLDQKLIANALTGAAAPLTSFVPSQASFWYDAKAAFPCAGMEAADRQDQAVKILTAAGYTWVQEPSGQTPGVGLRGPGGVAVVSLNLLVSSDDPVRAAAAAVVQKQAQQLGIPVAVDAVSKDQLDYAVFSSQRYDLALLGWTLGSYPAYLCDWFQPGGPFQYDSAIIRNDCAALQQTNDLEEARARISEIQTALAEEAPTIPLYTGLVHEAYRNVKYPFDQLLGGLSGAYGAPDEAYPAIP